MAVGVGDDEDDVGDAGDGDGVGDDEDDVGGAGDGDGDVGFGRSSPRVLSPVGCTLSSDIAASDDEDDDDDAKSGCEDGDDKEVDGGVGDEEAVSFDRIASVRLFISCHCSVPSFVF